MYSSRQETRRRHPRPQGRPAVIIPFPEAHIGKRDVLRIWLDRGIFACLCVIAAVTMQSAFAARWAFYAALFLWVVRLLARRELKPQPLIAPLAAFLVLLGIATSLSYAPLLSWERMSWFALLALAVMVSQTITRMAQVKILVVLLLLGGAVSAALTGWQYLYGIGTELPTIAPTTALYRDGLRSGDMVQVVNRHRTRSLGEWDKAVQSTRNDPWLRLHVVRGTPVEYFDFTIPRRDLDDWSATPGMQVKRGRPIRAQGHLYHYVPYAGELLQLAMLTFGLLVAARGRVRKRTALALVFIALSAALVATVTRTYLAALLASCALVLWIAHKRIRLAAAIVLLITFAAATLWVHRERGYGWLAPRDAGTEYREQMWRDSLHIIPQHPLFGVGPDSVLQYGDQWGVTAYKKFPLRSHFHSTFVQLAVDCGLPCLAAWCWLMTEYVVFLWRSWKRSMAWDWVSRGVLLGTLGGTIGFVLASFVHYTLGDGEVMMIVWMLMGLTIAVVRVNEQQRID